jgi:small subunit ribosomal protein S6
LILIQSVLEKQKPCSANLYFKFTGLMGLTHYSKGGSMAKSVPGSLPGYETTFIVRPDLTEDALKTLQDRLGQVVSTFQGEVVLTEDWGKRRLAYTIKKESRGHYTYLVYTGKGDIVHEVERNLRLHDQVLRFLTVTLGREFDPAQFKKTRIDLKAAAKRREEEREARKEERNAERRGYGDDRGGYRRHEADEVEDLSGDLTETNEDETT